MLRRWAVEWPPSSVLSPRGTVPVPVPVGPHPHGVQPLGNLYQSAAGNTRDTGLGLFARLPDELLLDFLGQLSAVDLCRLAQVSRACYVVASHDELWRALVLARHATTGFTYQRSWKETYASAVAGAPVVLVPFAVPHFYSEAFFRPWFNASMELDEAWLATENIPREDARALTLEAFRAKYERPGRPVILTHAMDAWPALAKWTPQHLVATCGARRFEAGPALLTMAEYLAYAGQAHEERPIYLFDPRFGEHAPALLADFAVPEYFAEDLFAVLGARRPNFRWIIVGPVRSGSSFHIDPNATSAWNAVLAGAKKWIMCPPGCPPPGVYPSADGAEVTAPVSIYEWFLNGFYEELRALPAAEQPSEGICRAGEVVFVPSGWWHAVINVDDGRGTPVVALTQNFASSANLGRVCHFLKNRREQVSGCGAAGSHLYEDFVDALRTQRPDVVIPETAPALWEAIKGDSDAGGAFSFSFGGGDEDE